MWKRSLPERRNAESSHSEAPGAVDEGAMEISLDELREFMEADLVDVHADPEFKHSLRNRLWELVRARNARRRHDPGRR